MKLRWYVAIGIFGVLLLFGLVIYILNKSSQTELEKYKAELRAQGEKLTFAELLTPYNEPDDELLVFVEAAKRLNNANFSPHEIFWMYSETPGVVQKIASQEQLRLEESGRNPTTTFTNWGTLVHAVAAQSNNLQSIRFFLENPPTRLSGSYEGSFEGPYGYFREKRAATEWFSASVLMHLHSNDVDSAMTDLRLMFVLANMHSDEPSLINQMIRGAITDKACEVSWELLSQESSPSESDLKLLQQSIERIDLLAAHERGLVGARNSALEAFKLVREDSSNFARVTQFPIANPHAGHHVLGVLWRNTVAEKDELFTLHNYQTNIAMARQLRSEQNFFEIQPALLPIGDQLKEVYGSTWKGIIYTVSSVAALSVVTHGVSAQNETFRRMTITAIALKRHELRHGKFPVNLNALVPEFLAAVPIDCMDGKPLKYKLKSDGSFLLYSVGKDGKDDGGDPAPERESDKQHTLWTGRDAVWPKAVR